MNTASLQWSLNQTLQVFTVQLTHFISATVRTATKIQSDFSAATQTWSSPVEFSPLQATLFKLLLALLIGTAGLIAYSWYIYGDVITEKFVRPSTVKEIEELKLSVAKLKLPKEHSPRI